MPDEPTVTDAPDANQYVAHIAGERAGLVEYIRTAKVIAFVHTEVDPRYEGRGVGSALVRTSLDDARAAGLSVLPVCPFYAGWISRHPEYHDLVYTSTSSVTD